MIKSRFISVQNFLVDIKGPAIAFLPVLAFEGGTRRNIPRFEVCCNLFCLMHQLQIGTLLYVRVVKANPGMNPELSCTDGCYMFECTTGLSRRFGITLTNIDMRDCVCS
ncbi:hypothetical protein ACSQ67_025036 [Phaseolus vulgaris]